METASQVLHRLTSYEPGRDWTEPAEDRFGRLGAAGRPAWGDAAAG